MHRTKPRKQLIFTAAMAMLSACGGGGDSPPPPVATASADAYSLAWNQAKSLEVLSNDTATGGTATISVVDTPKNGTATVSGTTISYTPKAGFFGTDSLSYQLTVGSVSSTATVALKVEASMDLKGVVTDGPIANAEVVAKLGDQQFKATADAQGQYTVRVTSSNPADFLTLTGTGAGTQSHVVLTGLAGDIGTLASQASQGQLASDKAPSLRITHVSTAVAGLLAQAGIAVKSSDELKTATGQLDAQTVVDAAALIKLVVDHQVPLQAEAKNTTELVSQAKLFDAFSKAQNTENAQKLEQAKADTAGDSSLASTLEIPNTGLTLAINMLRGGGAIFDVKPDGTAFVYQGIGFGRQSAKWTKNANTLSVMLDQAEDYGNQRTKGYALRLLGGGVGVRSQMGSWALYADKLDKASGQWVDRPLGFTPIQAIDMRTPLAFTAADFAKGIEWAVPTRLADPVTALKSGLMDFNSLQDNPMGNAPLGGNFVGLYGTYSVALQDGAVEFSQGNYKYRYLRLSQEREGLETWAEQLVVDGLLKDARLLTTMKREGLTAPTSSWLARQWQVNMPSGTPKSLINTDLLRLRSDNSASVKNPGNSTEAEGYRWALEDSGRKIAVYRVRSTGNTLSRVLHVLAVKGERIYAWDSRYATVVALNEMSQNSGTPITLAQALELTQGFWHFTCDGKGRSRINEIKAVAPDRLVGGATLIRDYANADCTGSYTVVTPDNDFGMLVIQATESLADGSVKMTFTDERGVQHITLSANRQTITFPGDSWRSIVRVPSLAFPSN